MKTRKYEGLWLLVCWILGAIVMAYGVDAPTPQEFGGAAELPWWSWFAGGDGFWGTLIVGILAAAYKLARPFLMTWLGERKLQKLFVALETGVSGFKATLTDAYKAAGNGKLTDDQKTEIHTKCKNYIIQFMGTQGVDVLQEYGNAVIDILIVWMLEKVKKGGGVAGTVVANLGGLAALPFPELGS